MSWQDFLLEVLEEGIHFAAVNGVQAELGAHDFLLQLVN
jgi:hypothetical protein